MASYFFTWTVRTRRARVIIKVWVISETTNSAHALRLCFGAKILP